MNPLRSALHSWKRRLRQRARARRRSTRLASILFPDGTQAFSIRSAFERLTIPVKIVFGAEDRIIPAHHALGLPGQVAVHAFPGLGHMPHLEAPAWWRVC